MSIKKMAILNSHLIKSHRAQKQFLCRKFFQRQGSHVGRVGLELLILLPPPPKCWYYMLARQCQTHCLTEERSPCKGLNPAYAFLKGQSVFLLECLKNYLSTTERPSPPSHIYHDLLIFELHSLMSLICHSCYI